MAFDASQTQEDDDQKNQSAGQPTTELSGGGGGFAGQGSPAQGGGGGAQGSQPASSGAWTNLNSYLSANADQAAGVGQSVATGIDNQAKQTQNDLSGAVSGFKSQDPFQSVNNTTSEQVDSAFSDPSKYANGEDTTTPERYLNNDWGLNSNNTDITKYAPSNGPSWSQVNNEFATADQNLQNTRTESGRGLLLQSQFGQGQQYTPGEQSFDQLLLQQNPDNQKALDSVYQQYAPTLSASQGVNGTPKALSDAYVDAQGYAKGVQDRATGFQAQAVGDLGNQISGLKNTVTGEVGSGRDAFNSSYSDLLSGLKNGSLGANQASALGIDPAQALYGADPTAYLHQNVNPYASSQGANYAATHGDWQNFSGLNALVGGMSNNAQQQSALSGVGLTGDEAAQANAPKVNPYSFDIGGFKGAVSGGQQSLQQAIAGPQAQVQDLSAQIADAYAQIASSGGHGPEAAQAQATISALQKQIDQQNAAIEAIKNQHGANSYINSPTGLVQR